MKRTIITIALVFMIVLAGLSHAEIYSYVDKDGVIHFSNVPTARKYHLIGPEPSGNTSNQASPAESKAQEKKIVKNSSSLQKKTEAEKDLLSCILFVVTASDDPYGVAFGIANLADDYAMIGQKEKANQLLAKAIEFTGSIKKTEEQSRNSKPILFTEIAKGYVRIGQKEKANQLFVKAFDIANITTDPFVKNTNLMMIAHGYLQVGQYDQALKVAKMINIDSSIVDFSNNGDIKSSAGITVIAFPYIKASLFADITSAFADAGKLEEANKILSEPIYSLADEYGRIRQVSVNTMPLSAGFICLYLDSIAQAYAKTGKKETALAMLSTEYNKAIAMPPDHNLIIRLTQVARAYGDIGQKEEAIQILTQCVSISKNWVDGDKLQAFNLISSAYIDIGQRKKAIQMLAQAFNIAKTIEDPESKRQGFKPISLGYSSVGQYNRALELAAMLGSAPDKIDILIQIAIDYTKDGGEKAEKPTQKILHNIIQWVSTQSQNG